MVEPSKVEYVVRLGAKTRYRHAHVRVGSRITTFRVQLEARDGGEWWPVVRYDTAHGFAHRDLMNKQGLVQKTPLFNMDYNDALTFAENDLKANWAHYEASFFGGLEQ